MVTRIPYRVELRDIDGFGHLSHVRALELIEIVRVKIYNDILGITTLEDHDLILAELTVRYHAQGYFGDELVLAGRVSGLGSTSIAFDYEIARASGTTLVTARTFNVRIDPAAGVPRPVGAAVHAILNPDGTQLPHPRELQTLPEAGSLIEHATEVGEAR